MHQLSSIAAKTQWLSLNDYKEKAYLLGHDAFDPGAADLSNYISERTQCVALHTNFSRLLIDPSKPIASD